MGEKGLFSSSFSDVKNCEIMEPTSIGLLINLCAWWQLESEPNTNPGNLAEDFSNCPHKLHEHVHDLNSITKIWHKNRTIVLIVQYSS